MQLLLLAFADVEDSAKSGMCILPICGFRSDFEMETLLSQRSWDQKNQADLLTKHVPRDVMRKHMTFIGLTSEVGRAESAPTIDHK